MSQGVHTCSEFCPCQTGGRPAPDFLPGGEGPAVLVQAAWERAADRERSWRETANETQAENDGLHEKVAELQLRCDRMAAALSSIAKDSTHSLTAMRDLAWRALR